MWTEIVMLFVPVLQQPVPLEALAIQDEWTVLEAEFDAAVVEWLRAMKEQRGTESEMPYPSGEFWVRYRAFADRGDDRAIPWLLRHGSKERMGWDEALPGLFARVRAAGDASWVADAIPSLVIWRNKIGENELLSYLERLDRPGAPVSLRVAALLGKADAIMEGDPSRASWLRQRAALVDLKGEDLAEGQTLSIELADELAGSAEERLRREKNAWYDVALRDIDGENWITPNAPPDPEDVWRTRLEALADLGSCRGRIWVLSNAYLWNADEREKERLKSIFDAVVDACARAEDLAQLARSLDAFVYGFGADFVEPRIRKLIDRAAKDSRPMLWHALGKALCEIADQDPALNERGVAILRDVVECWPDSKEAQEAGGQIFRFTNLIVGKPMPDFDALDVDGNAFKVSDFKGKVAVIDFWGFW